MHVEGLGLPNTGCTLLNLEAFWILESSDIIAVNAHDIVMDC
jgi:hypothetical protein